MTPRLRIAAAAIVLTILAYYLWTAATNGAALVSDLKYGPHSIVTVEICRPCFGLYNVLTESFKVGRLDLLVLPSAELLALPDPYDSAANAPYRLHDASLYKGRYYVYFGPVPALVLFLPFSLLHVGTMTEPMAAALFSFGAFLCAALVLLRLAGRSDRAVSKPLLLLALVALGVSSSVPFILRRPAVYEVAIASGAFFVMLGFCVLVRRWNDAKPSAATLAFVSLCWGLAVGCRPVHIISALAMAAVWIIVVRRGPRTPKSTLISAASLGLPFAACLFALGLYNYLRFDSWTEFGIRYQVGLPVPKGAWQLSNLVPGLYLNALQRPLLNFDFPFVHLLTPNGDLLPKGYVASEPIAGFLVTAPIIWCLLASPLRRIGVWPDSRIALLLAYGIALLLFEVLLFPAVTMRYQVDFIFPILTVALLIWLRADSMMSGGWIKGAFRVVCLVAVAFGLMSHFAFGLRGYFDLFRRTDPQAYFAIEDFSRPFSRLLATFSGPNHPKLLQITAPAAAATGVATGDAYSVNGKGFYLRFYSPRSATMKFSADVSPAPEMSASPALQVRAMPAGKRAPHAIAAGATQIEWLVPVKPGVNRVEVYPGTREEDGARRERAVAVISNVRLIDPATGQGLK